MGGIVAFVAFTLISYLLIVLKVPVLIIPLFIISVALIWKSLTKVIRTIKLNLNKKTIVVLAVFIIGIAGQLAIISPSGRFIDGDLVFWSSHGHDGMWHIALMEEIKKGWPFQNPVLAGEKLVNYHFFSDVAPAIVAKYTNISDLDLYFRIFPFFYSLFLGASAYYLTKRITKNFGASVWAVIFTYFAGSFGYIIGKGESIFWATQIQSASGNPPQIISDFMVLAFLYFAYAYIQKKKLKDLAISVLLLGTITEFKVYAAIVLMGAVFLSGIWQILIPAGILAAALYLPNSLGTTSFLILQPWWYIRTMIVEPSRLNWVDEELKRQTYVADHNWKRVISIEVVGFLIFFLGNLGMRFIGLWDFIKSGLRVLKDKFNRVFTSTIVISIVLPLLFLQKGVASNTAQFLQYFILLFGILAGISTARFIKLIRFPVVQLIAIVIIVGLMIPTQTGLLKDFYGTPNNPRPPFAKVSANEMEALGFLKQNTPPKSVILTAPEGKQVKDGSPTPNIWSWAGTGYVSALSGRREFFADREQVDIMGYNFTERAELEKHVFENDDQAEISRLIKTSGAEYIYFPRALSPKIDLGAIGLKKMFDNSEVEIWKI